MMLHYCYNIAFILYNKICSADKSKRCFVAFYCILISVTFLSLAFPNFALATEKDQIEQSSQQYKTTQNTKSAELKFKSDTKPEVADEKSDTEKSDLSTNQEKDKASQNSNTSSAKNSNSSDPADNSRPSRRIEGKLYVNIDGIDNMSTEIVTNIKSYLEIDDEAGKEITNKSYVRYLTREGVEQIKNALKPYGYYNSIVTASRLNDGGNTYVTYTVELGSPVIIKELNIDIKGQAKKDKDFISLLKKSVLKQGDILNQELYTKLKNQILIQAVDNGYFDGKFIKSEIVLNEKHDSAIINIIYDAGVRYIFNDAIFTQKEYFLTDDTIKRFALFHKGDLYDTKRIADTQRDLYNSGYVNLIEIATKPDKETKHVTVEFIITRNKNKKFTYAAGFGTDTGFRVRFDYNWRWTDEKGDKLQTKLFISQRYINNEVEFIVPAKKIASDYYKFFTTQSKDTRNDANTNAFVVGAAYHDQRGRMERETGIKLQYEDFSIGNDEGIAKMLTPYIRLIYKESDAPLNTYKGLLLDASLTGARRGFLSNQSFLQAVGTAKFIKRIDKNKLTLLGTAGYTVTDDFHELPPSYRFFTGGDRTVRGYGFNDIGDRDSSGTVIGGSKMYLASAEYEYFTTDSQAYAVFVDAGNAYDDEDSKVKVGAGIGYHYYSPIGPIKIDLAHGFDEDIGDRVRVHLTIGPDL